MCARFYRAAKSVFENKSDLQLYPVIGDFTAFVYQHFLILDPGTRDMLEGFVGTSHPALMASSKLSGEEALRVTIFETAIGDSFRMVQEKNIS